MSEPCMRSLWMPMTSRFRRSTSSRISARMALVNDARGTSAVAQFVRSSRARILLSQFVCRTRGGERPAAQHRPPVRGRIPLRARETRRSARSRWARATIVVSHSTVTARRPRGSSARNNTAEPRMDCSAAQCHLPSTSMLVRASLDGLTASSIARSSRGSPGSRCRRERRPIHSRAPTPSASKPRFHPSADRTTVPTEVSVSKQGSGTCRRVPAATMRTSQRLQRTEHERRSVDTVMRHDRLRNVCEGTVNSR